jgi:hypothetical protein
MVRFVAKGLDAACLKYPRCGEMHPKAIQLDGGIGQGCAKRVL